MKLIFPEYALKCLNKISDAGFEAYFVGGCVRDAILGRPCEDIDITTNALPNDIINLFEKTVPTGIKHGTVTVIIDGKNIEVTTYRTEGLYADHRHPETVTFVSNLKEDLARRDFTINALAYNTDGLTDLFDGVNDIDNKIIRAIGNPEARFKEDALRILRAVRFASTLCFRIDDNTFSAAKELSPLINNISGERVLSELKKISNSNDFEYFYDFLKDSPLSYFGIDSPKEDLKIFNELINSDAKENIKLPLIISLCNHNTRLIKEKLKPDNDLLNKISFLDEIIKSNLVPKTKEEIKMLLYKFGESNLQLLISYLYLFDKKTAKQLESMLFSVHSNKEPYKISHLKINGNHLINFGFSGKDVGKALEDLVLFVIKNPNNNTIELLSEYIKKEYHH